MGGPQRAYALHERLQQSCEHAKSARHPAATPFPPPRGAQASGWCAPIPSNHFSHPPPRRCPPTVAGDSLCARACDDAGWRHGLQMVWTIIRAVCIRMQCSLCAVSKVRGRGEGRATFISIRKAAPSRSASSTLLKCLGSSRCPAMPPVPSTYFDTLDPPPTCGSASAPVAWRRRRRLATL